MVSGMDIMASIKERWCLRKYPRRNVIAGQLIPVQTKRQQISQCAYNARGRGGTHVAVIRSSTPARVICCCAATPGVSNTLCFFKASVLSTKSMSETIYSLVPHVPEVPIKPPMYKSRHDPVCVLAGSTFGSFGTTQPLGAAVMRKEATGTFGPPVEALRNDPAKYLKKGTKTRTGTGAPSENNPAKANKGHSAFTYPGERKALVPRRDECPVTGIMSKANFVTANAVDTILAVPRCVDKPPVNYMEKEDYGKVPKYLKQVKSEISRENAMIDTFVREQMGLEVGDGDDHLEELQDRERTELLHALKAKWDTVNEKYQLMAHMVNLDTFGKLRRKEQMETQLKGLEKDIEKLEKTPVLVRP